MAFSSEVLPVGGGSFSVVEVPFGDSNDGGVVYVCTASPAEGYRFVEWEVTYADGWGSASSVGVQTIPSNPTSSDASSSFAIYDYTSAEFQGFGRFYHRTSKVVAVFEKTDTPPEPPTPSQEGLLRHSTHNMLLRVSGSLVRGGAS